MASKPWKKIAYCAAEEAYKNEVVDTFMEESTIGEDKWFSSKQEWIEARISEWIEEVVGVENGEKK